MAEVTQTLPGVEPPQGIGYSRGIGTNNQWETLFSGVADTGGKFVKAVDEKIQTDIYKDAEGQIEGVRDLFGVSAATPGDAKALPPDLTKGKDYLSRLQKGYENGTVRASHYYGQLNSIVKNLKSKYAGYGPEIDNIVQSITGVTPANSLIAALRQEAEANATAADASAKERRSFENQHLDVIRAVKPDYFDLPEDQRPDFDTLRKWVSDVEYKRAWISDENNRLELLKKQGGLKKEHVLESARKRVLDMTNTAMQAGMRTEVMGGGDYDKLKKMITDAQAAGGSMSPNDKQQMTVLANQLRLQITEQANKELMNMPGAELLSESERTDIIKIATSQVDTLTDAIVNEDYGLIGADAAWLEATKDEASRRLLEQGGHSIAMITALAKEMGPEAFGVFMQNAGAEAMDAFTQSVLTAMRAEGQLDANSNINDDLDEADRLMDMQKVDPRMPRALIEGELNNITDPETHPIVSSKSLNYLFGKKGGLDLSKFPEEQHIAVYSTLASPSVTARVKELAGDNVEMWENYTKWVYGKFFQVFRKAASDLKVPAELSTVIVPEFNPTTGQYEVFTPLTNELGGFPPEMLRGYQEMFAERYREYNTALRSVVGVMEAENVDIATALMPLLNSMGIATPTPQANSTGGPDERTPKQDVLELGANEDPRAKAIKETAAARGIDPVDLATAIAYETAGTFDPAVRGGKGNDYIGLIQFGPNEQRDYGASQDQDFETQMKAVDRFLEGRGLAPGSGLLDIYSTILAGSPGLYDRSDQNGSVRQHVEKMKNSRYRKMAEELINGAK